MYVYVFIVPRVICTLVPVVGMGAWQDCRYCTSLDSTKDVVHQVQLFEASATSLSSLTRSCFVTVLYSMYEMVCWCFEQYGEYRTGSPSDLPTQIQ